MEDGDGETDVVSLLSDEYNQRILQSTHENARSVSALSEECDADPSTIYRRIEVLEEHGLVHGQQQLDPGGHHYTVYESTLREVIIRVEADGLDVEIERTIEESPADRFTRLYEGFK